MRSGSTGPLEPKPRAELRHATATASRVLVTPSRVNTTPGRLGRGRWPTFSDYFVSSFSNDHPMIAFTTMPWLA
ncbi:MAG TPA: hypothetical protein VI756_14025, partial [Blastocatellia bacterium]